MMNDDMDIDDGEEIGYLEIDEEANTDFDDEWDDASVIWDEISEFTTSEGDRIGQKCMHMWGQRLCLCQFLGWMDSRKFQCQAKGSTFYSPVMEGPAMVSQRQMDRLKPANVARREEKAEKE